MYKYTLENGTYFLTDAGSGEVLYGMDEVGIAFSTDPDGMWTLHKHGRAEAVKKWYDQARRKYLLAGFKDIANSLVMVSGPFPVEELNKCLDISGYIRIMVEKLGLKID